jgi:hypothetical protein
MLIVQDNPKDKAISEHRINNFSEMIGEKSQYIINFLKDEQNLKKE